MVISSGDTLPDISFSHIVDGNLEKVSLKTLATGTKLVLFGLPGAFTRTCSASHLPGFIHAAPALRDKGVDHIVCMSVNDPFVMKAWDDAQGASAAGIMMLADGNSSATTALGLEFSALEIGFVDRCKRFSAYIDNGVIKALNFETRPSVCEFTSGETLLAQI